MSGARPGVEMRTRRSPTATWRASGLAGRTPMTRCDVSFASNDTPSGPGGARTSRMCSFATTGSAVTTSACLVSACASYTLSMSLGLPELLAGAACISYFCSRCSRRGGRNALPTPEHAYSRGEHHTPHTRLTRPTKQ